MAAELFSDLLLIAIIMAYCLFITEVLELLFALIFGVRNKKDLGLVALANALTNPWVVFIFSLVADNGIAYFVILPCLEIAAVAVEAFIYKRYSKSIRYPVYLAIGANLVSLILGVIISIVLIVLMIIASKS